MKNFKAHILVVDDDDGIRDLVKKYLNENNYLINTASNAEEAQRKIEIISFDIIILDIMMPGKSGLQFLNEIKKIIDTPVILLTAKNQAKEVRKVKTKTLDSIIESSKFKIKKIDFLTIDVEGHEYEVIKSIDLTKYKPEIILIEFIYNKMQNIEFYNQNIDDITQSVLYKHLIILVD